MNKAFLTALWASSALLGAVIVYKSRQLSLSYNAWTAGLRTRHSHINPPPTPKMRELNTKIMTWLIRILGTWILILSLFELFLVRAGS
jgi:hypothetical protein